MYHVHRKYACSEIVHIHTVMFCIVKAALSFSLELAGIRTHCIPFEIAANAN